MNFLKTRFRFFGAYSLRAFSLVELMVALIIVSCIVAALAPVITKKLSLQGVSVASANSSADISTSCSSIDENCQLCVSSKCVVCREGYMLDNDACVSKYQWGEPRNQGDCDPYNALYIPKEWNGGGKSICATKYNAGDSNGPAIPSTVVSVATGGTVCSSGNCCWKGNTAASCTNDDGGYGSAYSGCTRSVCNYPAALEICSKWAPSPLGVLVKTWRLATTSEAQGWIDNHNSLTVKKGSNGLQFCTGVDSIATRDGMAICNATGAKYCSGSYSHVYSGGGDMCHPYDMWLEGTWHLNYYGEPIVRSGNTDSDEMQVRQHAFSVRCVTDNVPYFELFASGS